MTPFSWGALLMISASEEETFVCRSTRLFWRTSQVDLLRSRFFYSRVMFRSLQRYSSVPSRLLHTVTRQNNVEKKKVIVLGAGWYVRGVRSFRCSISHFRGGFQFVRYLNRKKYDVTLVSCSAVKAPEGGTPWTSSRSFTPPVPDAATNYFLDDSDLCSMKIDIKVTALSWP